MKTKNLLISILILCSVVVFGQENNRNYQTAKHFMCNLNTGNNLTVGIPDFAWQTVPEEGDEIGIFNGKGELVGSNIFLGGHSAIAVWGDDETTKEQEGVESGDRFTMKLWSHSTGQISNLEIESWLEGDDIYKANGISIVEKMKIIPLTEISADFFLSQNIPNPVRDHTTIGFSVPRSVNVEISLYTATGEFVEKLLSSELPAGSHILEFDPLKYASGNYCYKMIAGDYTATKIMTITR